MLRAGGGEGWFALLLDLLKMCYALHLAAKPLFWGGWGGKIRPPPTPSRVLLLKRQEPLWLLMVAGCGGG